MKRLHAATAWLCCAVTALVAAVVLFAYGTTSFYLKGYTGEFPLSNPLLLLMAAAAFALLLGIYIGGTYGSSVSAILIRTPGPPSSAATLLDGYPLARQGRAPKPYPPRRSPPASAD